ncbi:MAG: hypothetical protein Q9211_005269 [Gyalolechia sp. 1 TL-2023]
MLSISHPNAPTYFDRDVNCVKRYFARRYHFTSDEPGPCLADAEKRMRTKKNKGGRRLDVEVEASGFSKKMAKELEKYMEDVGIDGDGGGDDDHQTGSDSDDSHKGLDRTSSRDGGTPGSAPDRDVASRQHREDEGIVAANDGSPPLGGNAEDDLKTSR